MVAAPAGPKRDATGRNSWATGQKSLSFPHCLKERLGGVGNHPSAFYRLAPSTPQRSAVVKDQIVRPDRHQEESRRSAALHAYNVLDTPREADFDDLAQLASEVCSTPIAVVNLVDTDRQFFKAEVGLGVRETPLETSFCGHAILAEDLMIVPDAAADPRFRGNPLVAGEPGLRFYAGALLKTAEGLPIGTLCVLDYEPRELDEHQIRTLRLIARQAMTQLDLRRSVAERDRWLKQAQVLDARNRQIVNSALDFGIITLDLDGNVTSWNVGAENIFGWTEKDMLGQAADVFFTDGDKEENIAEQEMLAARESGRGPDERWHLRKDGSHFWASGEMMRLLDEADVHVGYLKMLRDRTQQHQLDEQRATATRELSHRMKNSLAMVQSIIRQTFRATPIEDAEEAIFDRIRALADAQDILTQTHWTGARIEHVVTHSLNAHRTGEGRITIAGPDLMLTSQQALGLSLAIHELATNAAKYGALANSSGRLGIVWSVSESGKFRLDWIETGGPPVALPTRAGFGSKLLERIVAPYFDGEATLTFPAEGCRFVLQGELTLEPAY
nr:HWE histidine kinase domain-containing protein [Aurantimonas marianensis]